MTTESVPAHGRITLEHTAKICKQAYPPGKYFTVPPIPDVELVNARGDYAIEADRLAFIDGDRDPWRVMVRRRSKRARLMTDAAERSRSEAHLVSQQARPPDLR